MANIDKPALRIKRTIGVDGRDYTGEEAELTYDPDDETLHVHNGQTPGGLILAKLDELLDTKDDLYTFAQGVTDVLQAQTDLQQKTLDGLTTLKEGQDTLLPAIVSALQATTESLLKLADKLTPKKEEPAPAE